MEEYRDQRMRYLWEERYDHRRNMADFDYHFKLAHVAEIINYRQYLEWRESGVAFESRFSSYIVPNRTMSSYLPGYKVKLPPKSNLTEITSRKEQGIRSLLEDIMVI